jgi:hypothetical protein
MSTEPDISEHLESIGVPQVRLMLETDGLPSGLLRHQSSIIEWLASKDQEAERLREASQSEQIEIARSASRAAERAAIAAERASAAAERQATAAERANTRASIALVIATISIIATAIGIWVVHRDAILSHIG